MGKLPKISNGVNQFFSKIWIVIVLVVLVAGGFLAYHYWWVPKAEEQRCINSGGTVSTSLCCKSVGDFPNLCLIGPCGCAPEHSHRIKICECNTDKCFNGTECVSIGF